MTPKIETDRLLLRPIEVSDAKALFALINNRDVAKWLTSVPWPYTLQDAQEFVTRSAKQEANGYYVIEFADQLAGCISCTTTKDFGYWVKS